jgi:hypothetical protein
MSGSCCGGSPKSKPAKVTMTAEAQATEATTGQPAANTQKSGCCNDKPKESEKRGCCC